MTDTLRTAVAVDALRTVLDRPPRSTTVPEQLPVNPPGSTKEQLPDDILALLPDRHYLSTACETARLLLLLIIQYPDRADLKKHRDRMHARCRMNHKYLGHICNCPCHVPPKEAS